MINPCAECLHHILGKSKSAPKCTKCKKRLNYVAVIGRHPSCPVPDGVNLNGHGGYDMPEEIESKEPERAVKEAPAQLEQAKICSRCKMPKPFKRFHKNKGAKDGYHFYCK